MSHQVAPPDFELAREGDVWVPIHVGTATANQNHDPAEAVVIPIKRSR